jgi:hypothetical protein
LTTAALVVASAGCSGQDANTQPPSASTTSEVGPGAVALGYIRAVTQGDFTSAAEYVTAGQQGMLQALALGTGAQTPVHLWGEVSLGRVITEGDQAVASIVGTMCRLAPAPGTASTSPECVENSDPATDSPLFQVHLTKIPSTGWKVTF